MEHPIRSTTIATEAVGNGLELVDRQRQRSYRLNATAALVWQHCDGHTPPPQLTELLRQKCRVPHTQAEQLTWLALDALATHHLLEATVARPQLLSATHTHRQMLTGFGAAGMPLALVPMVALVPMQADERDSGGRQRDTRDDRDRDTRDAGHAGHTVIPLLDCVVYNGDGTLTAHFGYVNQRGAAMLLPVGPQNMCVPAPPDRGQPILFEPGTHADVFAVVFDSTEAITWRLQADGDRYHEVTASADSELCAASVTTTARPLTTLRPPTQVHMFWAYGALSKIERLAVSSFLANGYAVTLWSYGHIPDVPSEAVLRDAREILPESAVFLNRRGSYAGFSDLFRYAVLRKLGGLYADTDVIALQPYSTLSPRPFLVLEHGNPLTVTGNLIWHPTPAAGDLIDLAFAYAERFPRQKILWGAIGPTLLTDLVMLSPDRGFDIKPPAFANPMRYWDCPTAFLAAGEIPDSPFVHLYNEMWRQAGIDKNQKFDASTVIGKLFARFA